MNHKILITGGDGVLAKELTKYCNSNNINVIAPSKKDLNILKIDNIKKYIKKFNPDIIIHAAAFVDTIGCERYINKAIDINVIGTSNVVKCCIDTDIKLVYISSEYVFSGKKGSYTINDRLDPINIYGKSKSAGEYLVSILKKYQILRIPFIRKKHPNVFKNQYCSRFFVEEIPNKILNNVFHNTEKIIHISRNRLKLSEVYKVKNIKIKNILIPKEIADIIPKDTGLVNTSKF